MNPVNLTIMLAQNPQDEMHRRESMMQQQLMGLKIAKEISTLRKMLDEKGKSSTHHAGGG